MEQWKEEDLHALVQHRNEQDFFDHCSSGTAEIGFEYCSYGMAFPLPLANPKIVIFNNYPKNWWDRYQSENYMAIDPTIAHAFSSTTPLLWNANVFASAPKMWDEVKSHGLNHGWGQPTRDTSGTKGMLTISRGSERIGKKELSENAPRMLHMAQTMMVGMTALAFPKALPESSARLTPREKEVLCWAADGKTSYEIGRILILSISAVNFHIKNAMTKLNANNKTQAVVKAALLGLLH